jgi:hypothetical protein
VEIVERFNKVVPAGKRSAVVEELIRNKTREIELGKVNQNAKHR